MPIRLQNILFALLLTGLTFLYMPGIYVLTAVGVGVFYVFVLQLVQELGRGIPIRPLVALMAALQLVVGTALQYHVYNDDVIFRMIITEEDYMTFAVPALLAFVAGLYLRTPKGRRTELTSLQRLQLEGAEYRRVGFLLLGAGLFGSFFGLIAPASLRFLAYLLSNVKVVGAYYLYIAQDRNRYVWLVVGLSSLLLDALRNAVFHDLLLWGLFSVIIVFFILKPALTRKTTLLVAGFLGVFLLQAVKTDYRATNDRSLSFFGRVGLIVTLYADRLGNFGELFEDNTKEITYKGEALRYREGALANATARFNQGRIVGLIMAHVPRNEPFAGGETVMTALEASFLPRFLAPNKIRVGGHAYYERFTGIPLPRTVSIDLGLLGEAYANFGRGGGIAFMFVLGLFFNVCLIYIFRLSRKYPTLPFWIPFIFLYSVKAEVDLATILNQMSKATMVVFGFFVVLKHYLKRKRRHQLPPTAAYG